MSISATVSIWNDVDSARPGMNRSTAHSRTACGSSPSNSIDSSPASSSSINSNVLISSQPPVEHSLFRLLPYSSLRRLEACQCAQLLVRCPPCECRKALAVRAALEPAGDQPLDRRVERVGGDAPEERAPDGGLGAEPAADEDVVGLPLDSAFISCRGALEAQVADPVLRAGVGAAVEMKPQARDLVAELLV